LAVRRSALTEVGNLDERFFLYSEETDWCYRLHKAGWEVRHLPVMEVLHHGGGYARPELAAQLSYSKLLFSRKHFGPVHRGAFRTALALRHLLRAAGLGLLATVLPSARRRLAAERGAVAVAFGRRLRVG
jgi:GT2 family glycosyltransferase